MARQGAPKPDDIAALERKLAAHDDRQAGKKREKARRASSPYGFGFRLVTELVTAVIAGFLAGWGLDTWLGTSPWLVLIFVPLGMAAGILNVVRAARSAEAQRHLEAVAAAAPPEEGQGEAPQDANETILGVEIDSGER